MSRKHVFADEAGNFDFRRADNVSAYFIVCTVTMMDCARPSAAIMDLKRELAWDGYKIGDYFHATTDTQEVRDRVFEVIRGFDFRIQATIMEKSKAAPKIRPTPARFYQHGWFYHFSYGMQGDIRSCDEMHITAASVGTKKSQIEFTNAVRDVVKQTVDAGKARTSFWQCSTDPCLQLADYCTWAIQRKWERGDTRSYDLIKDRIGYEYDMFRKGDVHYY